MDESWSISELVDGSKSEHSILVPDSDSDCDDVVQAEKQGKLQNISRKSIGEIIESSDEDTSRFSTATEKSSINISKTNSSQANTDSSLVTIKPQIRKNKNRIIESDEESDCSDLKISIKSPPERVSSGYSEVYLENSIKSPTERVPSDRDVEKCIKSPNLNQQASSSLNTTKASVKSLPNSAKKEELCIDLTLSNRGTPIKNDYRNYIVDDDESDEDSNVKSITIDSESDDDTPGMKENKDIDSAINSQLNTLKISTSPNTEPQSKLKLENNDYLTRVDSLRAEDTRLKAQVSEVMKTIDTIKTTLRTANLSALPDKGVRLQVSLRKEESKLRDLRYQQSTLSNEIIKLQMHSKMPQPQKQPKNKVFKLPTTNTDINTMGKKALETHRTQQALTVDALAALHNSMKSCPNEDTYVEDPKGLRVTLMNHQKNALVWLLWREKEKPSGGILADDMGLGKTLTMISLILKSHSEENEDGSSENNSDSESDWMSKRRDNLVPGKTLVICPASLIDQWAGEIKHKVQSGILDVLVHHGNQRDKSARRLARHDVVITTYTILPRDCATNGPLFGIRWERVIIDEAHQIRNYKTLTAQAVFKLKGKHRWALTGTPVHNKELDFYALLKFLRCVPFDDLAVWKRWVDNRDAAGIQRLNTITKSLMLRRTKKGLQEQGQLTSLKAKNFHTILTNLDENEQSIYEKLLKFSATLFAQFLHQKAEQSNALPGMSVNSKSLRNLENPFENNPDLARLHKQMKEVSNIKSHHILVLILRLRQFCCHPALITSMLEKEEIAGDGIEDADGLDMDLMDKMTRLSLDPSTSESQAETERDGSLVALSKTNPLFAKDRLNSKMKKVLSTLEDILSGDDKVVVVSQWVSLLEVIHSVLKKRSIRCVSLNGTVPVKDRGQIVEKFNRKGHGPRVMLLSLTAGGVGLNLASANHLLLLDLHWNPQLENQACDRIYRVGQEKEVHVYKFVVSETIEERILKLQETKKNMANDILTGAKHVSKLSLDDLKMLFHIT